MNNLNKIVIIFLFSFINAKSQRVLSPSIHKTVIEQPQIRASDILWHKRVLREIDLKEKQNSHLYFSQKNPLPDNCFFDILLHFIKNGDIIAYSTKDDNFSKELSIEEVNILLLPNFNSKDVVKIWLKEDWIFNSLYSKIEVRIVGICPVIINKDSEGTITGYKQLFWLYFPNIRATLVNYDAIKTEETTYSFDDIFINRMFSSLIINRKSAENNNSKNLLDEKLDLERSKFYQYDISSDSWGD
jgi:gliding motility associated protien GldN